MLNLPGNQGNAKRNYETGREEELPVGRLSAL